MLILLLAVCAFSAQSAFIKKESMVLRETFVRKMRANPEQKHELVFAIKQRNLDILEKEVLERSTPGGPKYQKWMTFNEVGDLVGNPEGARITMDFLATKDVNVTWVATRKEYLKATASIKVWEEMFDTTFYNWFDESPHSEYKEHFPRALEYSVPEELAPHLHCVFHVIEAIPEIPKKYHLRPNNKQHKTSTVPNMKLINEAMKVAQAELDAQYQDDYNGRQVTTISFLNAYYKITSNTGSASLNQSVFETSSEEYSQNDLNTFATKYGTVATQINDIGGFETSACSTSSGNCDEGNLDVQYITAISQVTATTYWYVGGSNPFVTWVTDLATDPNPPASNSMSWGSIEQQQTTSTLSTFNTEAMKLGAIGVTVTISSADNGVANYGCPCSDGPTSSSNCACKANSGSSVSSWTGTNTWTGTGYFPSFPATSPYVTAVGATMGTNGYTPAVGQAEIACQSQLGGVITSGGGFSTYYAQPSWQTTAVNGYFTGLTSSNTPAAGYNNKGRAYPDMSMLGVWYQVVIGGSILSLFGTSCSSPVTAGLVSLVNAARRVQGLGTIGFMNPTIYANGGSFNDVTSGYNKCCANGDLSNLASTVCCNSGFYATSGWDPVTGFGSISYPNFAKIFGGPLPTAAPVVRPPSPKPTPKPTKNKRPTVKPTKAPV